MWSVTQQLDSDSPSYDANARGAYDSHRDAWVAREEQAERLIPIIGRLYRQFGVVSSIHGHRLINLSTSAVISAHERAEELGHQALTLEQTEKVLRGLLGADVIGFQRAQDATYFLTAVRRRLRYEVKGPHVAVPEGEGEGTRTAMARAFPISIDTTPYLELAAREDVRARAAEIRASLGNPKRILLGVDRLDYTKGIRHRIKAYGELLAEGRLKVEDVTLVQVASPSRERVDAYVHLRDEIELAVSRINGDTDTMGHSAIRYLHQGYPREEMVALYLAADVMLVTALRDGMNLVAKEYVATRVDDRGVLVLSEFTGAADELRQAVRVNPHDIEGLKDAIMTAVEMPPAEQGRRMRSLRRRVLDNDVNAWSSSFLKALSEVRGR